MRLTLRTLLAYLDDILEPVDAEELGGKIRESDFASGLVHRIRGATGRMRLSSPPVIGKGMGNDANTVAEYLDNTLPTDRIPDFERVCLESDMHLAEAASCHEVLTLVLGEPAHIEDSLRERIHRIGNRTAPANQVRHRFDAGESTSADETGAVSRESSAWRRRRSSGCSGLRGGRPAILGDPLGGCRTDGILRDYCHFNGIRRPARQLEDGPDGCQSGHAGTGGSARGIHCTDGCPRTHGPRAGQNCDGPPWIG